MTHALELMHQKNIIHRDVSPDNIFLTTNEQVKLLDFGAARLSEGEREETLMAIIKPGYAPPEQYRSRSKQGSFTDVYGLGATMYRILTGVTPDESIDRQIEDTLKRPSQLGIKLDPNLEKSIMKAMALKPELRFQSMKAFREAVTAGRKVDYPEVEFKKRRRNRVIATLMTIAAMIAVVIGVATAIDNANPFSKLEPDTISVWVPVETEVTGETRTNFDLNTMAQVAALFNQDWPDINIQLVPVEADRYAASLRQNSGSFPTLFLSEYYEGDLKKAASSLELLTDNLDMGNYLFLSNYANLYPSKLEIPLSFDVGVVYTNTLAEKLHPVELAESANSLTDLTALDSLWDIWPDSYDGFVTLYGGAASKSGRSKNAAAAIDAMLRVKQASPAEEPGQRLLEEELVAVFAEASTLRYIQANMPGFYRVVPAYNSGAPGGILRDTWSVSNAATKNQKRIAMLFITYLLGDYTQNLLYVQSDSYLPLNRETLGTYIAINPDLEFLQDSARNARMVGETARDVRQLEIELSANLNGNATKDSLTRLFRKYKLA